MKGSVDLYVNIAAEIEGWKEHTVLMADPSLRCRHVCKQAWSYNRIEAGFFSQPESRIRSPNVIKKQRGNTAGPTRVFIHMAVSLKRNSKKTINPKETRTVS